MAELLRDKLKLLVKPAGVANLFDNAGGFNATPAADNTLIGESTANCTVKRYADGSWLVTPTASGSGAQSFAFSFGVGPNVYPGEYASLRMALRWSNAQMSKTMQVWREGVAGAGAPAVDAGASAPVPAGAVLENIVMHRGVPSALTGPQPLRVVFKFTKLSGSSNQLQPVRIEPLPALYLGPAQYMVETPVLEGATQEVTGDTITIVATRGNSLKGAVDSIEPGVLKAIIKGADYEPGVNLALRPGSYVWLVGREFTSGVKAQEWRCVWAGKVLNGDVSYDDGAVKVTVEATDYAAELANTAAPIATGRYNPLTGAAAAGIVSAARRLRNLLDRYVARGTSYTITDTQNGAAGDATAQQLDSDDSANVLTQIERIANTSRGVAWVGAGDAVILSVDGSGNFTADPLGKPGNRVNFLAGNSPVTAVPRYTWTDNPAEAGLKYTDLKTSFSARALLNSVKLRIHQINTDVTYGPYRNLDSFTQWAPQEDTVELHELTGWAGGTSAPDPALTAQDFLRRFAVPTRYPSSVTVNVTEDVAPALLTDVYDAARVKRNAVVGALDVTARVLRLTHTITADRKRPERGRWQMQLDLRPDWQNAAVTVSPPDATGDVNNPGSVAGNTDPDALQPISRRSVTADVAVAANVQTSIPFGTADYTRGIDYDAVNRWWTIPKTGRYLIGAWATCYLANGFSAAIAVLINGVNVARVYGVPNSSVVMGFGLPLVLPLTAGDHVQIAVVPPNNAMTIAGGGDRRTGAVITYLGG